MKNANIQSKIPLFDIDWTLLRGTEANNQVHFDAYDYAFQTIYRLPKGVRKGFFVQGKIDPQILIEIAVLNGVSEEEAKKKVDDAMTTMVSYFREHLDEGNYQVMPGVKNLLDELKSQDIPIGLLTGNIEEIGWEKLSKAGIKDYFEFGAFGSMALKRVDLIPLAQKRAEEIYKIDIPLQCFVIVGDSPLDIACARDGGISVIAVGAGHFKVHDLSEADLVVESLEEKDKILRFLNVN